jgi:hypothetical protein
MLLLRLAYHCQVVDHLFNFRPLQAMISRKRVLDSMNGIIV